MSREEAVALGEGVTAGPWYMEHASKAPTGDEWGEVVCGRHPAGGAGRPVPGMRLTWARRGVGDVAERNARLVAAAPRLRETVVELHDRVAELEREVDRLRAQVADVGWSGEWFHLDGVRLRWLRVHGGTDDQTWHLIDDGMIAPQVSLWRDGFGRWFGRRPNAGAVERSTAAAACEALYSDLTPPAGCEP